LTVLWVINEWESYVLPVDTDVVVTDAEPAAEVEAVVRAEVPTPLTKAVVVKEQLRMRSLTSV
jgi:hypothetical protein